MSKTKGLNITIDGQALQVEAGKTVFQAASDAGIFVPHYCYHPDLSIAGVCRMCMVDIEKNPRLQISCNTPVTDGMVVRTNTDKVKESVKSTLELHLINHPLDCPICDKAGECKLQDFYEDYGLYASRMEYEKVHKPKVVDIGAIVLDSERCILCTRCVRFTDEVTHTHELGIFNRGDRSELKTYDDGPLHNDYTGNLADICPVGALTAKDFRFQCRVWFLDKTESVCTMCARGCNTTVSVKPSTDKLYRVEPRRNPEVNKSWMCDTGRWDYNSVYSETRLQIPKRRVNDIPVETSWHEIFETLNERITTLPKKTFVALSTQVTNEEALDALTTFKSMGVENFGWLVDESKVSDRKPFDGVLKHRDLTGNSLGLSWVAKKVGISLKNFEAAHTTINGGKIDQIILLGMEGEMLPGVQAFLAKVPKTVAVIAHTSNAMVILGGAEMWLPNTTSFEKSGTVTNALSRAQKLNAAIASQYISRNVHAVVWGICQGADRIPVPASRAQILFESTIRGWLKDPSLSWKKFPPLGVPVSESE